MDFYKTSSIAKHEVKVLIIASLWNIHLQDTLLRRFHFPLSQTISLIADTICGNRNAPKWELDVQTACWLNRYLRLRTCQNVCNQHLLYRSIAANHPIIDRRRFRAAVPEPLKYSVTVLFPLFLWRLNIVGTSLPVVPCPVPCSILTIIVRSFSEYGRMTPFSCAYPTVAHRTVYLY